MAASVTVVRLPLPVERIVHLAAVSPISRFDWSGRGVAPAGYIKGMALVYARVYCKLKAGNAAVLAMAQADTGDLGTDALAWYRNEFAALGMSNAVSGADTLRHLFVLLVGLGMRESSGRYCEGLDRSADPPNTTAEKAEAGLFQASYNLRGASPLLPALFLEYSENPSGFVDIFKEGVRVRPRDLENFGTGAGRAFQKLSKECPAFAAEFSAAGLRFQRRHWGPINRKAAQIRPECDALFRDVQNAVDASPEMCGALQ